LFRNRYGRFSGPSSTLVSLSRNIVIKRAERRPRQGPLYYLYMSMLSTFCTNSINILAGINGSEVSQALIIAISVIINDLLYLPWPVDFRIPLHLLGNQSEVKELRVGDVWSAGMSYGSRLLVERHLFSLYFMLPLVGVCLGFLYHNRSAYFCFVLFTTCVYLYVTLPFSNRYPATAFPGDTLCYVTGMAFAVVGIQAHFSKTLLLFFLPQIFNFVLSCPQLFGLVPCPRHRVPRYDILYLSVHEININSCLSPLLYKKKRFDSNTRLLHPSTIPFMHPPSHLTSRILHLLSALGLTRLTTHAQTGQILEATNLTILNWFLVRLGPMSEGALVRVLAGTQAAGSLIAFVVRYGLAGLVYDGDRR
jgi:UDP-N-acetylglucosamine--dolichyl-phosphate N-acetylglucosaminephosphotransferase